jgi:hypothetical protein
MCNVDVQTRETREKKLRDQVQQALLKLRAFARDLEEKLDQVGAQSTIHCSNQSDKYVGHVHVVRSDWIRTLAWLRHMGRVPSAPLRLTEAQREPLVP